ncbi:MAG: hypothetical protein JW751_00125, partial [Polyangiaceae bacterium]|nr:hypothetical protein [Polyangiaceae bacterium]
MSAWRNSERRDGCRAAAAVRGGLVRSLVGVVLASLLLACAESPDPAPSAAKQALEPAPRRAAITAIHTAILGVSAKVTGDLIVTEGSSAMEATLGSASELVGSLAADAVVIGSGAEVTGDVEHNSLLNAGTVGGALVTPLALPLRAEIPPDVSCQPGTALVLVGGGQTVALASGAYGIVILTGASSGTPATLQLGGGTYELSGIIAGAFGVVECLAPCDVRVAGPVVLGSSSRLGAGAPEVGVLDVILTQPGSGQTLIVGAEATLDAYAVSRLGLATLGSGAQARGKLVADQVILGSSSRFVGLERPLISAQPAALAVREGQAAEFHVGAEGEGLRYQWLHGDDPIPGAISATFTVPAAALTDAGEYRVVVANDAGRVTSAAAGLTVIPCEPNDITCNDFDDDCDGQNDEDVPVVPTSCGTGACQACGFERCIEGALVDDCTPGVPAASDATCDGSDDDCDGSADEEYQPTPTACGVGACAASGQELCVGGGLVDTCAPLPAAPDDSVCDGVDADCDGAVDEDYLPTPTACGIGACAATGQTACEAGVVVSHCTEGLPTPDTVCNGVDDDCDGAVDEDYLP